MVPGSNKVSFTWQVQPEDLSSSVAFDLLSENLFKERSCEFLGEFGEHTSGTWYVVLLRLILTAPSNTNNL